MNNTDVYVIGGGAAGLCAAITCAKQGAKVTIIEGQNKIGKKILITGNGKCNLSNFKIDPGFYESVNEGSTNLIKNTIKKFTPEDLVLLFEENGMITTHVDGYVYPHTLQAQSVVSTLLRATNKYNIRIIYDTKVNAIKKSTKGYQIITNHDQYDANKIIIACGGKSYAKTGSDGSGYELLKSMNLDLTSIYPGLTAFICNHDNQKLLSGLRHEGICKLYTNNHLIKEEKGQIQFTDYGLSGIAIFNLSNASQKLMAQKEKPIIKIDLFPNITYESLFEIFAKQIQNFSNCCIEECLQGLLHTSLISYVCKKFELNGKKANKISVDIIKKIISELKEMTFTVHDFKGYQQ